MNQNPYQLGVVNPISDGQIKGLSTIGFVGGVALYFATRNRPRRAIAWRTIGMAALAGIAGAAATGTATWGAQQFQEA
jgi:hypothetical protein